MTPSGVICCIVTRNPPENAQTHRPNDSDMQKDSFRICHPCIPRSVQPESTNIWQSPTKTHSNFSNSFFLAGPSSVYQACKKLFESIQMLCMSMT